MRWGSNRIWLIALAVFLTMTVAAQTDSCLVLYRTALVSAALECDDLSADSLCYGNIGLSAELIPDVGTLPFSFPGHRLNVRDVAALESAPLDLDAGDFGVALGRLGVRGSDSLASLVVIGDATITNHSAGLLTFAVRVTFADGIFARSAPTTEAEIVQPLAVNQEVLASGRIADSSWLQVIIPGDRVAWVSADLVAAMDENFAFDALAVTEDTPQTLALPFRDLTLVSGINDSPCEGVPESGILLQSPEESALTLRINGQTLSLDGTVFVQAEDENVLMVSLMDGTATISSDDTEIALTAGERYDSGADIRILSYDYDRVESLPYELLEREVIIESHWLDVLIPATDQPLAGLTTESACTIAVGEAVTVRVGPGTDYQRRGSLLAGQSANPTGRAVGSNGRVWWRITGGAWVANDVVVIGGNCNAVPQVEVVPRIR